MGAYANLYLWLDTDSVICFVAFNTYNVSATYVPIRAILVLIELSSNADRARRLARILPARLHNVWMYIMFQTKIYTYSPGGLVHPGEPHV